MVSPNVPDARLWESFGEGKMAVAGRGGRRGRCNLPCLNARSLCVASFLLDLKPPSRSVRYRVPETAVSRHLTWN